MHNAGLKFTKLLRIHITDMDPGTVHTQNPNLINKRGNEQTGKPGPTCSLSECDWILQDVLKTLESSMHSFLIKSQFGLYCSLLIFDQDGRDQKRKKGRGGRNEEERKRCQSKINVNGSYTLMLKDAD